MEVGIR